LDICLSQYYWQDHRGDQSPEFWRVFELTFPRSADYVKSIPAGAVFLHPEPIWGGDTNNSLAGLLDALGHKDDVDNIELHDNEIRWYSIVWHFANWEPFCDYVKKTFIGVRDAGYVSDEYSECDYYDMI
jgi:hypothetical protein